MHVFTLKTQKSLIRSYICNLKTCALQNTTHTHCATKPLGLNTHKCLTVKHSPTHCINLYISMFPVLNDCNAWFFLSLSFSRSSSLPLSTCCWCLTNSQAAIMCTLGDWIRACKYVLHLVIRLNKMFSLELTSPGPLECSRAALYKQAFMMFCLGFSFCSEHLTCTSLTFFEPGRSPRFYPTQGIRGCLYAQT